MSPILNSTTMSRWIWILQQSFKNKSWIFSILIKTYCIFFGYGYNLFHFPSFEFYWRISKTEEKNKKRVDFERNGKVFLWISAPCSKFHSPNLLFNFYFKTYRAVLNSYVTSRSYEQNSVLMICTFSIILPNLLIY